MNTNVIDLANLDSEDAVKEGVKLLDDALAYFMHAESSNDKFGIDLSEKIHNIIREYENSNDRDYVYMEGQRYLDKALSSFIAAEFLGHEMGRSLAEATFQVILLWADAAH